jgi:hypothetical protein
MAQVSVGEATVYPAEEAAMTWTRLRFVAIPLLCVVLAIASYWVLKKGGGTKFPWFWFTALCPLPFGFWFGRAVPGSRWRTYTLVGFTVGMLNMIGIIYIYTGGFSVPRDWSMIFWQIVLGATLLFTSGGLFADLVESRGSMLRPQLSDTLTAAVITGCFGVATALITVLFAK